VLEGEKRLVGWMWDGQWVYGDEQVDQDLASARLGHVEVDDLG